MNFNLQAITFIFFSFFNLSIVLSYGQISENPIETFQNAGAGIPVATPSLLPASPPPKAALDSFKTDFSKHTVSYSDIIFSGNSKNSIPPINTPKFISVAEASSWLKNSEPVLSIESNGVAKAYPIQIIIWHKIINDEIANVPVAITYCPLSNTGVTFIRKFGDTIFNFGTTGHIRFSNLLIYDEYSETWWQQATGQAIAGKYAGSNLSFFPTQLISWKEFKETYSTGLVMSLDTGYIRAYGRNPYLNYDSSQTTPLLYQGPFKRKDLPFMERVVTIKMGDSTTAYPFSLLENHLIINDYVNQIPVVIMWSANTNSPLDTNIIAQGRLVGSATTFHRTIDNQVLNFRIIDNIIKDIQTSSTWNTLGKAISGPFSGKSLQPIIATNQFSFSWLSFYPSSKVYSH